MNSKQIKNVMVNIFKELGISQLLDVNPIIAGGSVADLIRIGVDHFNEVDLNKAITGDIDVFVPYIDNKLIDPFEYVKGNPNFKSIGGSNFQLKLKPVNSYYPEINIVRTRNINNEYVSGRVNTYQDLVALIDRFDLECIKCGIILIPNKDTNEVLDEMYIQDSSYKYIFTKVALLSKNGVKLNSIYGLLARLYKYKLKGYKIDPENEYLLKSKAAISDISLTDICKLVHNSKQDEREVTELYDNNSETINRFAMAFSEQTYGEAIDSLFGLNADDDDPKLENIVEESLKHNRKFRKTEHVIKPEGKIKTGLENVSLFDLARRKGYVGVADILALHSWLIQRKLQVIVFPIYKDSFDLDPKYIYEVNFLDNSKEKIKSQDQFDNSTKAYLSGVIVALKSI